MYSIYLRKISIRKILQLDIYISTGINPTDEEQVFEKYPLYRLDCTTRASNP
jgi:hypothetical protein